MSQDDFCAPIVFLDPALDADRATLELANVAEGSQVRTKDDHGKGAGVIVSAKIEERHTVVSFLHAHYGTGDAVRFADMFLRISND